MNKKLVKITIGIQAIIFLTFGIVYALVGNIDKWFERWELGLILAGLYGIMQYLEDKP